MYRFHISGIVLLSALLPPLTAQTDAIGVNDTRELESLSNQVIQLYRTKAYAQAVPLAQQLIAKRKSALGPAHVYVADDIHRLANIYKSMGNAEKAKLRFNDALNVYEKALGFEHPRLALISNNLGMYYFALGDYAKAEPLLRRSATIYEKSLGSSHPRLAKAFENLSKVYYARGDYTQAESAIGQAIDILQGSQQDNAYAVAQLLNNLGITKFSMGEHAEAVDKFKTALVIAETSLGPKHPKVLFIARNLAATYRAIGEEKKALSLFDRINSMKPAPQATPSNQTKHTEAAVETQHRKQTFSVAETFSSAPQNKIMEKPENRNVTRFVEQPATQKPTNLKHPYSLHLASFRSEYRRDKALARYVRDGFSPFWAKVDLKEKGQWFRIYIGQFATRQQAKAFRQEHGLSDALIRKVEYANLVSVFDSPSVFNDKKNSIEQLGSSPYVVR